MSSGSGGAQSSGKKSDGRSDCRDSYILREQYVEEFTSRTPDLQHVIDLLNVMDDSSVCLKDAESRYVYGTKAFLDAVKVKNPLDIVFSTDYDFFAPIYADTLVSIDRNVIRTGTVIREKVGQRLVLASGVDWVRTSTFPVRDRNGMVIGVSSISEIFCRLTSQKAIFSHNTGDGRLDRAIEYICDRARENPSNDEISEAAHVSNRQLGRLFQQAFCTSPQRFLASVKLDLACRDLRRDSLPIVEVALDLGFGDQSSFTAWFRRNTGITPKGYRGKWRSMK